MEREDLHRREQHAQLHAPPTQRVDRGVATTTPWLVACRRPLQEIADDDIRVASRFVGGTAQFGSLII